jgi:hypothetical protein
MYRLLPCLLLVALIGIACQDSVKPVEPGNEPVVTKAAAKPSAKSPAKAPKKIAIPAYTSRLKITPTEKSELSAKLIQEANDDHRDLVQRGLDYYKTAKIDAYTCTFRKHERIRGELKKPQQMKVKFTEKPFRVAMAWVEGKGLGVPEGDRIIFVAGQNMEDGKAHMIVRPSSGFARTLTGGSVLRIPDEKSVMKHTLRPCTMFGFKNSLENLHDIYTQASKRGELAQKLLGTTTVGGKKCLVLLRVTPNESKRYPCTISEICLDAETFLPYRIVGYTASGKLYCDYIYTDVNFKAKLTAKDFTRKANGIKPK